MADNPLAGLTTEELMREWWNDDAHTTAIAAENRRRLEDGRESIEHIRKLRAEVTRLIDVIEKSDEEAERLRKALEEITAEVPAASQLDNSPIRVVDLE